MYKTNATNSQHSAANSNILVPFPQGLSEDFGSTHNPDYLIIDQVFDHYHHQLKQQDEMVKMLVDRKINPDYIDQFQLGYSDRTLGFELQSPRTLLGSRNRGHLQRLGLLKDTGHEFFQGSLVIPYRNDEGQISGAYGRRPKHQRRSPAYHLYWNAQQVSFFNADQCLSQSVILCKSALDVLTLISAGFDNVIATMGLKGFNDVQLSRLQQDGVEFVYLAFDNAPPGNHYALLASQALDAIGIQSLRVELPVGQDVNRFALKQTDVADSFLKLIDEAVPFSQRYEEPSGDTSDPLLDQLEMLDECVEFYLDEAKQAGLSSRTLKANQYHLNRFLDYCCNMDINRIRDLSKSDLESYWQYLQQEKNDFTNEIISSITQQERMSAVRNMLIRLYYYDVIPDPLSFPDPVGMVQ